MLQNPGTRGRGALPSEEPRIHRSLFAPPEDPGREEDEELDEMEAEEEEEAVESPFRPSVPHPRTQAGRLSAEGESRGERRERARRVAELKIGFYRSLAALVFANTLFFLAAYFNLYPNGEYWFVWPLSLSGLAIFMRYLRAFVLRGKSLQGYVDAITERLEQKEYERELG